MHFERVALAKVIKAAREKVKTAANKKQIHIVETVPDVVIEGDQKTLTELFVILLDNAIKYSQAKKQVAIEATDSEKRTQVRVQDQGIGIAKEDLPHIFDRFYRADKSRTKQEVPGYGLGLSIAKRIVQLHNGTITAESESGKGTTFTIVLPKKA